MDWSTRKRLGCISVVVVIIAILVGYFVYEHFIKHVPTCFDGIQNQNERGIDCGGICSLVCPMDARTVVTDWARVFHTAGSVYSMAAYVENQNPDAGVKQVNYEFRVYDDQNILAGDPVTGTTFIGPNDKTAIFESPVNTGNRVPKSVFFQFTETPLFYKTDPKYQLPQLSTTNVVLTDESTAPKVSADVVNSTLYNYKNIPVVAILYDADNNAINASQTYISEIPQQTTQKVYFTWPASFDEKVTRIEIIPRLDPFTQQ